MNTLETRVAELVQTYPHLYDRSRRDFRDSGMSWNSWKEIALKLGVDDPKLCKATWKNIRDKFGKAMKRMKCKNADEASSTKVPRLFLEMSWLKPYVRHRQTVSNMTSVKKVQTDKPSKKMMGDVSSPSTAPSAGPSSGVTSDSEAEERCATIFLDGFGTSVLERSSTQCKADASSVIMSTTSSTPSEPRNRRKRRRDDAEDTDIKQVLAFLEKDKSDIFDRHAQIVADFMRKLPPRHCAVFKKRLQDVMFDIEMQVLEEQSNKTPQ
ncbi:MADF domain-containing protein [Myxocyprinus asiaticus]|uniref:MADF domain-containing protein n=1 Tax=Myxocyprinus asiaticus TaxID=70543 RepID=UPI0022222BE6|nr:MADF domain-containing protein [Myxocyprinus asiaticus]